MEQGISAEGLAVIAVIGGGVLSLLAILRIGTWFGARSVSGSGGVFSRSKCRWKRDGFRHGTRFERWVCGRCGVKAYSMEGSPPGQCKRALRDPGL